MRRMHLFALTSALCLGETKWIPHKPGDPLPLNTVEADPGRAVCRAPQAEKTGMTLGQLDPAGCRYEYGPRSRVSAQYEVLTGTGLRWAPQSKIPGMDKPVVGGFNLNSANLLICRGDHDALGWLAGGVGNQGCYVTHGDQTLFLKSYELLYESMAPVAAASTEAAGLAPFARDLRIKPIAAETASEFRTETKVAIIAGVSDYPEGTGLSPLRYAAHDASFLAKALEANGYRVRLLREGEATRAILRRSLREMGQLLKPGEGTFLFYFGGHGFAQKNRNYLATYGVTADDLFTEGMALSDVEQALKDSHARRAMLFVDACRSNPIAGRSTETRSFDRLEIAEGLRVLYATREGQVSYEDTKLGHGVFSYFLGKGVSGEAAGADGLVTFRDLSDYVTAAVRAHTASQGTLQVPFEAGESSGDFLVSLNRVPVATVAAPPIPLPGPAGGGPSDAAARVEEIKRKNENVWRRVQDGYLYEVTNMDGGGLAIFKLNRRGERDAMVSMVKPKLKKDGTQDPKVLFEGTGAPSFSKCRSGLGLFQILSRSQGRIDAKIEHPNTQSGVCGVPVFRAWEKFELIKE